MFSEGSHTGVATTRKVFAPHFFHFAFFWCRRTLLEFGILAEFTGQQVIYTFSNDKLGESCLKISWCIALDMMALCTSSIRSGIGCLSRLGSM
jgi:hypothetical protein